MSASGPNTPQHVPPHDEPLDPIPNPEPASPSLDEPDPGVFHHDPADGSSGQLPTCAV